jgi:PhnB protein
MRDAQRVIDFLKEALGASELRRFDMPDGTVMHAEVRIDDSVIMLAEGSDAYPPFTAWLHVYVPDVDATYRRALDLGAEPVQEPRQREGDPDRRGGVKDPAGTPPPRGRCRRTARARSCHLSPCRAPSRSSPSVGRSA